MPRRKKIEEDPDLPDGHPWIRQGCDQASCPICYPEGKNNEATQAQDAWWEEEG